MEIKISVIVPFYGVEKYIARCTESLMCQTMQDDIEFIFVNDATKDNSLDVLQKVLAEYPERKEQITILHHERNKGLPAARNTGLSIARGKYIYHCDSDDYLEKDALEVLYRKAEENESDIVWGDFYEIMTGGNRYKKQPAYSTPLEAVKGMLIGEMDYNVWNKLVRRDLFLAIKILPFDLILKIIQLYQMVMKQITFHIIIFIRSVQINNFTFHSQQLRNILIKCIRLKICPVVR